MAGLELAQFSISTRPNARFAIVEFFMNWSVLTGPATVVCCCCQNRQFLYQEGCVPWMTMSAYLWSFMVTGGHSWSLMVIHGHLCVLLDKVFMFFMLCFIMFNKWPQMSMNVYKWPYHRLCPWLCCFVLHVICTHFRKWQTVITCGQKMHRFFGAIFIMACYFAKFYCFLVKFS